MKRDPRPWLGALGQALSAASLYDAAHPTRAGQIDTCHQSLAALLEAGGDIAVSFVDSDVVVDGVVVPGFAHWEWASKLATVGIERIEATRGVGREDVLFLLDEASRRLTDRGATWSNSQDSASGALRFGWLRRTAPRHMAATPRGPLPLDALAEELALLLWMHDRLAARGEVPAAEAGLILRALRVAMMRSDALPLLVPGDAAAYAATHASNVAVLTMAVAETRGEPEGVVQQVGLAALVCDVGMALTPRGVVMHTGPLDPAARARVDRHTVAGARVLAQSGHRFDLGVVVALEHHLPVVATARRPSSLVGPPHPASRLVRVCDVYDALTSHRPFRLARSHAEALALLAAGAGRDFDADFVTTLAQVFETRGVVRLDTSGQTPARS